MSKRKITIVFESIHQLWAFAQKINTNNIEIITAERILICDCSAEDVKMLREFGGEIRSTSRLYDESGRY